MKEDQYYSSDNLYFSLVYGNGIYQWTGELVSNPLSSRKETDTCPLLTNIITNETVFMRKAECDQNTIKLYREKIWNPPDREYILWPLDIVSLSQRQNDNCVATIDKQYTWDIINLRGNTGVLFPWNEIQGLVSLNTYVEMTEQRNWKSRKIQKVAVQLVETLLKLNKSGSLYNEFHLDKIYVKDDEKIFFDYSGLTYPSYQYKLHNFEGFFQLERNHYPVEFAEPSVILGKKKMLDLQSQNYSVAALLFYLFVGRYCYDGRLLAGNIAKDMQQHYIRFRDYHRLAVFIFDPEDDRNRLGNFVEEERIAALWDDFPRSVQDLFTRSLSMRGDDVPTPIGVASLEEWMACFREIGWV